jgi:hypothetical protein
MEGLFRRESISSCRFFLALFFPFLALLFFALLLYTAIL